jgi:large subunit ribosomal protein L18
MDRNREKLLARKRRHHRLRKKVKGTIERPRLAIYRSLRYISAQLIDDTKGITLLSISSLSDEIEKDGSKAKPASTEKGKGKGKKSVQAKEQKGKVEVSRKVGTLLAKKALEKGIKKVVFDRGGFQFHGRIKSLAEGARKAGLDF